MKHFLKAKRKKSPEPPQQSGSSGRPADVAAVLQAELDVTLDGRHSLPVMTQGQIDLIWRFH